MRKNIVALISFLILIVICLLLITCFNQNEIKNSSDKIQIIATLFPQYDFAKHIVGDKAEVKLLLNSGVETHNYEPTPKDMITINNSDMFLYTGNDLEPWTESIISSIENDCKIIDVSDKVELIKIEEFEERHINKLIWSENETSNNQDNKIHNNEPHIDQEDVEKEHVDEVDNNAQYVENEHEGHNHSHGEIYDGHIWLDPRNAIQMVDNIAQAICELDPLNKEYYKQNAEKYKQEIMQLDTELEKIVDNAQTKEIAVGGEFAYAYLVERYGIDFVSVYNNCGDGEDPSIAKVKSVIDYMNNNDMKIVFYEELTEGTVAKMIAEETQAESLILYSIHNADISKDTYVSLFQKNIENLKTALY